MRRLWMIALLLALGAAFAPAQQTAQPTVAPIHAEQTAASPVSSPVRIGRVVPDFPDRFMAHDINGRCAVSLTVDVKGIPQDIKIIRCTSPALAKDFLAMEAKLRYEPATTQDGKPVAAEMTAAVGVQYSGGEDTGNIIRFGFGSSPGTTSAAPDADGVYPLTKLATRPTLHFSDQEYGNAAFMLPGTSPCDVLLTISKKGKASDPMVLHCEKPSLDKPAVDSLLKARYKPGKMNGKAVPMRVLIHLEYGGFSPK